MCDRQGVAVDTDVCSRGELLHRCRTGAPIVVISDARVLEPDAPAAVSEVAAAHRVLVLDDTTTDRPRMLRAGASGFVGRDVTETDLVSAVTRAEAGVLVLDALLAPAARIGSGPALSPRETEVLRLVAGGEGTDRIARTLKFSASTVKTHLRNINEKLGTQTRAAAACRATALGLLG
jgi:DNA-binding NarL/FixJ family response regulator